MGTKRARESKTLRVNVLVAVSAGLAAGIDAYNAGHAWPYLLMLVASAAVNALLRMTTGEPIAGSWADPAHPRRKPPTPPTIF